MTVPKRFGVLRLVGMLMKILAWIILIFSVIFAIAVGIAGPSLDLSAVSPQANALIANGGIFAGIMGLVGGLIYFLILYAAGESLQLQVAMEENTRLTAALLLRMHQDSQIDAEPDYGTGGFAPETSYQ